MKTKPSIQFIASTLPCARSGTRRKGTGNHPRCRNNTAPHRAVELRSASEICSVDVSCGAADDILRFTAGDEQRERSHPRQRLATRPLVARQARQEFRDHMVERGRTLEGAHVA